MGTVGFDAELRAPPRPPLRWLRVRRPVAPPGVLPPRCPPAPPPLLLEAALPFPSAGKQKLSQNLWTLHGMTLPLPSFFMALTYCHPPLLAEQSRGGLPEAPSRIRWGWAMYQAGVAGGGEHARDIAGRADPSKAPSCLLENCDAPPWRCTSKYLVASTLSGLNQNLSQNCYGPFYYICKRC